MVGSPFHRRCRQGRGCPCISPTEKDSIPLKGGLILPSAMMQFLSQESTGRGGKVQCGEKFPCVPGLEGQQQLEEWIKGEKGWAGLGWSCLGNKPLRGQGGGNQRGIYRPFSFGS